MFLLWVIAVVIAVIGVMRLFEGRIGLGILLLVVACAVGPGGWSVLS